MIRPAPLAVVMSFCCLCFATANASTVVFFDASQVATNVESGVTSDTISSNGYLFTYTRDKLFTGGIGPDPIGRYVRVPWPVGVEAQAVTTPPPGVTDYKARITLKRVDGDVFDLTSFTAKLLANTAGTGAAIEIMPLLNGEDAFNDPLYFDASGYYGNSFYYGPGSTTALRAFDTYKIGLFVDFALTTLTLEGAAIAGPPGDFDLDGAVDGADFLRWQREFGTMANPQGSGADGDGNGQVDAGDLMVWQQNYGGAPLLGFHAIPEPCSLTLLMAAVCVVSRVARRPTNIQ